MYAFYASETFIKIELLDIKFHWFVDANICVGIYQMPAVHLQLPFASIFILLQQNSSVQK